MWTCHVRHAVPDHSQTDQHGGQSKCANRDAATEGKLAGCHQPVHLSLFGGFTLDIGGRRVGLPRHARRVLAYLSLLTSRTNDIDRRLLAERLWPDAPQDRAAASVRTALWRIRRESAALVHSDHERVSLGHDIAVDVHSFQCLVARLLSTDYEPHPGELHSLIDAVDLLPTWDEDWLVLARERLRQRRLMALESVAGRLSEQGRHLEAIELMLVVIAAEPLRESAHAIVIEAHLRQRNRADAHSHLLNYARELWLELRVHPSPQLLGKLGMNPGRLTQSLMGNDRAAANLRSRESDIGAGPHAIRVLPA
jgi:DNA-binding SARP family transcriptional activator